MKNKLYLTLMLGMSFAVSACSQSTFAAPMLNRPAEVPEPSSIALVVLGLIAMGYFSKRK